MGTFHLKPIPYIVCSTQAMFEADMTWCILYRITKRIRIYNYRIRNIKDIFKNNLKNDKITQH